MHPDQGVASIAGGGQGLLRWHLGRAGREGPDGAAVSLLVPAGRAMRGRGRGLGEGRSICTRLRAAHGEARVGLLLTGR